MNTDEARRLGSWLASVGAPASVTEWTPLGGGRSATSVRVRLEGDAAPIDAVLHIEADDGPLLGMTSAARQFALLRALSATRVKSPDALWLVPASVLGRPAYLTRFQSGHVPDPWSTEGRDFLAAQEPGGALAWDMVRRLVDIHAVAIEDLDDAAFIPGLAPGDHPLREHRRWSAVLASSRVFSRDPLLAYADAWLGVHRPEVRRIGLVHGDYRIGNVVIDGDRIVSVLDWELAEVGDPLYDLATLCSPPLRVNGLAGGLWEPSELIGAYEQLSGEAVESHALEFFSVLAAFKVSCLWINTSLPYEAGADDLTALRAGYSVQQSRPLLAEALGLEVPEARQVPDRAVATLRTALRGLASRTRGDDRVTLDLAAAVLRERGRELPVARADFPADVAALARDTGMAPGGHGAGGDGTGAPTAADALVEIARAILDTPGPARDPRHPLHARLRALVAESAATSLWP